MLKIERAIRIQNRIGYWHAGHLWPIPLSSKSLRFLYILHPPFDSILTCRELCFFGVTGAGERNDGSGFLNSRHRILLRVHRRRAAGFSKGAAMNAMYVISAILAGTLLVYLFAALLMPERF